MLINEYIYKVLKEKGMSQIEFAQKTGISQSTISDWRRKGTNPSADKIMIICEVLNVSPYELLSGTESNNRKEYKQPECMVMDKNSKEYHIIELYRKLDLEGQHRLEGYLQALTDVGKDKD